MQGPMGFYPVFEREPKRRWVKQKPLSQTRAGNLLTFFNSVSKTLGGAAERLWAKRASPLVRETASSVYHVISGSGYSEINGQKIQWKQGDTFCIPAWNKYQHFAGGDQVYLYRFDDKPMLRAVGFYRLDGVDPDSVVSE